MCDRFIFIRRAVGALGGGNVLIFEPMKVITQQGTTKTKAGTMRCCAWVIIVEVMGYLIHLELFQDTRVTVGEGGKWLCFVVIEGGDVIPCAVLLFEHY